MKNGIVKLNSKNKLSKIFMYFNIGSKYEDESNYGISHLAEHLVGKVFDDILCEFDNNGIKFNAYTSHDFVCFLIFGIEEYIEQYIEIFINRLLSYEINEYDFNKEKEIVLNEIDENNMSNLEKISFNIERKYYNNFSPLGDKNIIKNYTYNDMKKFIDDNFKEPFSIVFQIPNVNEFNINNDNILFKDNFNINHKFDYGEFNTDNLFDLNEKGDELIYFRIYKPIHKKYYGPLKILSEMIGNGLTSILVQELREKNGLTYSVSSNIETTDENIKYSLFLSSINEYKKIDDIINNCFNNFDEYFTESLFNNIKSKLIINDEYNKECDKLSSFYYNEDYSIDKIKNTYYDDIKNLFELDYFNDYIIETN